MAASKKNKKPKTAFVPSPAKSPKIQLYPDFMSSQPAWRISLIEMKGPFGWHAVNEATLYEIREKLANFEKMTWSEILVRRKKRNHSVEVSKLCKDARDRLRMLKQDDIDELLSLGLSGKERVWGIREDNVLKVLWWDSNHSVCPSMKKHTEWTGGTSTVFPFHANGNAEGQPLNRKPENPDTLTRKLR